MEYTTSRDGTRIAYERAGTGPAVVLVASALADHRDARRLARHLSDQFTVFNHDRRGRGQSGEGQVADVDREVEDLVALVHAAGGRAALFGSSSGAILALEAANVLGEKVSRLALFDPPFIVDSSRPPVTEADLRRLQQQLDSGQRSQAVKDFMTRQLGAPPAMVAVMRVLPMWRRLKELAPTLVYDLALLQRSMPGGGPPADRWSGVTMPTLVLTGAKSDTFLQNGGRVLAEVLPAATHASLAKASHSAVVAAPRRLAEVLAGFFGGDQFGGQNGPHPRP